MKGKKVVPSKIKKDPHAGDKCKKVGNKKKPIKPVPVSDIAKKVFGN